ncbi:3-hydroxyacyl-CoA dehydrogenase NAD-binding domain-containing protein [Lentibacter sp. XHP0401]|jgi:3-hydroxyacyl-CoA dehydrogenase / enoyl-CoA hydratase / 3-hydroxybutyryl-CoA epimerase|uniref:3-hydroxyacyl-CoA dehydrogenase NAD-binding domain-containing protein n=1 Tax=Lentibacter sp. XHP0401 TaxID=2984334 RepID=UPI0021E8A774|nr:3-hydroxyacyl-CoA dehydrogenase NAD-binding domain-containing protein [Lentibacter sp. XHP0401]MCV2893125.1 3-hydroxyacyl-CoA dehydrogenase NAD-binding domain-containing protein [Lentibacter sp. XHP0401]
MTDFTLNKDAEGIATITWDTEGKSMNVMSIQGFSDLSDMVDDALADDAVKGIIITSGKEGSFAGGMDLNVIAKMKDDAGDDPAKGLFDGVMNMHAVLRKIERAGMDPKTNKGGKPIACVMPGTALGIGFEIPLSCHRTFVANNPKAKIGLPEIMVGIFPGAGGTTRLVRKLGAMAAAPFLLQGKLSDPAKAKQAGLIDEVSDDPMADARAWVLSEPNIVKPWDEKGYKMPGGAPYHPAGFMTFLGASVMVHSETQGAFPAAKALLSAVYEGALVPFDTALKIETRWFVHTLLNPSSSAMIRSLFINKEALEKGAVRPADVPDQKVRKIGVLGAGMMGAGIALVSAQAGMEVVLIDRDQAAADKGKAYTATYMDKGIARKKATPEKKEEMLARITATPDLDALKGCDLIIEAVFEDPAVKAEMTKKVEAVIPEDCIFASNTSTLPITDLAKASARPEQFIGIHFFSPVEKMLLVEIIKGEKTGDRAVAKALDYVRQIRKTPIVVNDARFFYCNRCIIPYINEGLRMITEGVSPSLIDNAARQLGFPVGPLQLNDETSIDLGAKIARATKAAMGDDYPDSPGDDLIFWMEAEGRLGRKANAGFYEYDDKGKRTGFWPGLGEKYPLAEDQPDLIEVQERLMFSQVLEAVRALEEGVVMDIREADVGAILAWGFAPWSGGPLSWLDMIGTPYAAERTAALAAKYGTRFETPALLKEMGDKGQSFYTRFAPEAEKAA